MIPPPGRACLRHAGSPIKFHNRRSDPGPVRSLPACTIEPAHAEVGG